MSNLVTDNNVLPIPKNLQRVMKRAFGKKWGQRESFVLHINGVNSWIENREQRVHLSP